MIPGEKKNKSYFFPNVNLLTDETATTQLLPSFSHLLNGKIQVKD
jgi:hypothetical protein